MPIFSLEDFPGHLRSLRAEDWDKLFRHLPALRSAKDFGDWQGHEKIGPHHFTMPYVSYSDLVSKIQGELYELGLIIGFKWSAWEAGRELFSRDPFHVEDLDTVTICQLITAITRNDRFCEGALLHAYHKGSMQTMLYELEVRATRLNPKPGNA